MTGSALLGVISAGLGLLALLVRLFVARRVRRQAIEETEAKHREEQLQGYKETRQRIDDVEVPTFHVDRTDDLRRWLRERAGKP